MPEHVSEEARRLVESEAFRLAVRRLDAIYYAMWCNSAPLDTEKREQAYRFHLARHELVAQLTAIATAGKVRASAAREGHDGGRGRAE